MSPEIMENQRYNSKTDIWSLGCILYELVCLRLPFDGSSMKQLCYNIIKTAPAAPPSTYSAELRELVRDLLHKNPKQRPGINAVLARPLMRSKITALLGETTKRAEFSHTVLHGANVLQGPIAVPAPPLAPPPPGPPAAPAQRPISAPSAPAPVAASAAQAVAMLQQQRQVQLLRQQQAQAQQQQYVNSVAAQMKEQVDLARRAEAERVRAQQLQAEEALRRQKLQVQAQAHAQERAKAEQSRLAELQRAAERAKAAAVAEAARVKQQQELEKLRRAALAEQQQKLEKRRQERLEYEAQRARQEKERDKAQRARLLAYQQQQPPPHAKAGSPSLFAAPAVGRGKAAVPVAAPVAVGAKKPAAAPQSKAEPAAAPAPVRQFSAAALLAKRRHSAPEKSPGPVSARPPWVSVLDSPPAEPPADPSAASPAGSIGAVARQVAQPTVANLSAAENPFKQIVGEELLSAPAVDDASEEQSEGVPRSVGESATPVPRRRAVPSSPSSQGSARSQAVDSVISKAQGVLLAMQDLQVQNRERVKRPPIASPTAGSVGDDSCSGSKGGLVRPPTPAYVGGSVQDDDCSSNEDDDAADSFAAPIRAPPTGPPPVERIRIDTSPVPAPDSDKGSAAASPWLSDLLGQMGQLKNQMQNLQHLRSPAAPVPHRAKVAADSPNSRNQASRQPSEHDDGDGEGEGDGEGDDGQQSSPSVVSSITATSPGSAPSPLSGPSSANTPRDGYAGHPFRAVSAGGNVAVQQEPRRVLQQRAKAAHVEGTARGSGGASGKHQRMSYPLTEPASGPPRPSGGRPPELHSNSYADDGKLYSGWPQRLETVTMLPWYADDASASSLAKEALSQRKEARDRHKADFRAFVQARRQQHDDHASGGETPASSATPPLRLDVPAAASPAEVRARGMPPVAHKSPHSAAGTKGKPPSTSKPSAEAAKPWHAAKASAPSGRRNGPSSNASPVPTPSVLPAQSPHSVVSSSSSCPSLLSPRADGSVGFNVAEFRSQREAERGEMRQLMKERRQQLRRAAQQHAEVVVLAQDPPPPRSAAATPTVPSSFDHDEPAPAAALNGPVSSFSGAAETTNAQESQLFAHLHHSVLTEGAPEASEVSFNGDGSAAGGATLLEYSVLIEQMQAILRAPAVRKPAALSAHTPGPAAAQFTISTGGATGGVGVAAAELGHTGRALVGDLLLESVEDADLRESEHDGNEERIVGAGIAVTNGGGVSCGGAVEDEDDEFGEEDDPLAQEAALLMMEEGEGDRPEEEEEEDAEGDHGSAFGGSDGGSSQAGSLGDGEDAELLTFPETGGPPDPFMQPLVPSLLTADALLLLDPLRHAFPPRPSSTPSASAPAPATPPQRAAEHPQDPPSDQSEKGRRLRVAELHEYLVSKLGSAKVSEALHLLTQNTSATITPGADTPELTEAYYEERDEELLNRLEEILGTDSLHYLDDMFLLLTLQ